MISEKRKKITYLLFLFIFSSILGYFNLENRDYSWDLLGYLGSTYQISTSTSDSKIMLETIYTSVKKESSTTEYNELVGNRQEGNWKYSISKNPDAFAAELPYYSIKVFYIFIIYLFSVVGFSPTISVFLPNLISFFIFGFLLFSIFKNIFENKDFLPFCLTLFILIIPQFRYLASNPSPDMIAVLLMTWFIYILIKKHNLYFQFIILLLLVLCRPDFIIFCLSYLLTYFLFAFFKKKKFTVLPIIFGTVMISIYLLVIKINQYPGWKDVFYDTFIHRRLYVTGNAQFTFKEYCKIIFVNIFHFKKISVLALLFLSTVYVCSKNLWLRIFAILLFANIYIKFIIFPASGGFRFFIGFLLLRLVMHQKSISVRIEKLWSRLVKVQFILKY